MIKKKVEILQDSTHPSCKDTNRKETTTTRSKTARVFAANHRSRYSTGLGLHVLEAAAALLVWFGTGASKAKIQKIKDAAQSDRSTVSSKDRLMFNNQRARRFDVGNILYLPSKFHNCSS